MDPAKVEDTKTPPEKKTPDNPVTPDNPSVDTVKQAQELGSAKARIEQYENYIKQVMPIMDVITKDAELNKSVLQKVNQSTQPPVKDTSTEDKKGEAASVPDPMTIDNRNSQIVSTVNSFLKDKGILTLPEEESKRIQGMLANELGEILDPKGNKTLPQVFQEVSLTRLPNFLEKAYSLVENQLSKKADPVIPQLNKASASGAISSLSAASGGEGSEENITLSASEKETAQKMGISEEKYLENKKSLSKMRSQEGYE